MEEKVQTLQDRVELAENKWAQVEVKEQQSLSDTKLVS